VPRKTKTTAKEAQTQTAATAVSDVNGSAAKAPRSTPAKSRKSPARKVTTKRAASKKGASKGTAAEPTHEEIRIRAYFIAERRHRLALAGDADSDWLEAKRQLVSEAAPK
jgi:Protein of unknown function (DUF2934)